MGKYRITDHQTGKSVVVSGDAAPNDQEAEQIFADAGLRGAPQGQAAPSQRSPGMMDTAIDMARAIPGGLAKGVSAIAGLPGDMEAGLTAVGDWALGKVDPEGVKKLQETRANIPHAIPQAPTSGKIAGAIAEPFGGFYEPKTTAGNYAETVASFAPNAIAPGSLAARVARVVVPGVASEAGGQAVKGTQYEKYEPLARAVGGLAGGIAEGVGEGVANSFGRTVPTMDELKTAKTAAYKTAEQHGVVIKDASWHQLAADITTEMNKKPFRPDLHPGAVSALDTIASEKGPVTLENADAIRQVVNDAIETAGKNNGGDLSRATKINAMLDDYLDNLTPADTVAGDPKVAVPILKEARSLAQKEFKARQIEKLIDLAENQAGSNYSASGVEQALRAQFKNLNATLIKNPNLAKSFSAAERDAIEKVIQGGPAGNALRLVGKLAPTNVISGGAGAAAGATVGGAVGGPVGAAIGSVAVPTVGAVARMGATAITKRNAELASQLMRAGVATPQAPLARNALLSTLLSQGAH